MARPKGINQKARWRAHSIRLAGYADRVQSVYDTLNREVANAVVRSGYDGTEPFRFSDYPQTKKKIEEVQAAFVRDLRSVIYSGTSEEWKQSNLVQDLLADNVLKFYGAKKNKKKYRVYYQTNSDALKAFQQRKDDGLNLSQKLWNQSKGYKEEMEFAISSAIEKGTSAVKLSKRLSKYLQDFPSLKHDYKEKFGKAVTCQDCEYRSIRLARSEINMAYRKAEQERWKQFDFVLGYEVKLTQNGHHVPDICDDLAGKYPKDFIFVGWHPNCMCYVVPILKTEEQFWNDEDASEIVEPPKNFTDWLENNSERLDKAAENDTLPYWYTDNAQYVNTTRWESWRKLLAYDEDANEEWLRVQKWKDSLGLDTSKFEAILLKKDAYNWQYWGELDNLITQIDREKERYYDAWEDMRVKIYSPDFRKKYGTGFAHKVRRKFKTLFTTLQYDAKATWDALHGIDEMISEYGAYLSSELVDVVVPSFTRKAAGYGAIGSDVARVRDQLNALVGTARKDHYGFLDFRDHFDHMATTGKLNDTMQLQFAEMLDRDEGAVWKCIDHLNEMARAKDLKKIPKRWYRAFNRYMEDIRDFDIEVNGYGGVYNQIEGAYNIYKLSTNPAAIKYGLTRVSEKTPWNLFEVFTEKGIDLRYLPEQQLFRYEGDFVPWYDAIRNNVDKDFKIRSDAHYHPSFRHVAINREYFDQDTGRAAKNMYEVKNIFYHEYGHALDYQRNWKAKKRIVDTYDRFAAKYDAMEYSTLEKKFNDVRDKFMAKVETQADLDRMSEQAGAVSDIIQAMRKDHRKLWSGHKDGYFDDKYSQLAEFIAHMNEAYWQHNEFWEAFDPEMYKEVRKIMRVAYRGASDGLDK